MVGGQYMINLISTFTFFTQLSLVASIPIGLILILFHLDKSEKITGKKKYYTLIFLLSLYFIPVTSWLGELFAKLGLIQINLQEVAHLSTQEAQVNNNNYFAVIIVLWIVGVILSSLIFLYFYVKLRKQLSTALPVTHEIILKIFTQSKSNTNVTKDILLKTSQYVNTPILVGCKNPTIYLPISDVQSSLLPSILTHELIHYKRKDLWVKAVMICIQIVHWYNPLVHLFAKNLEKYQEFSCDEIVISILGNKQIKNYGYAILAYAQKSKPVLGSSINNYKIKYERRLTNMLNVKNQLKSNKLFSSLLVGTLVIGLSVPTVANAMDSALKDELQNVTQEQSNIENIVDTSTTSNVDVGVEESVSIDDAVQEKLEKHDLTLNDLDNAEFLGTITTNNGMMVFTTSNVDGNDIILPSLSKETYDNLESVLQENGEYIEDITVTIGYDD